MICVLPISLVSLVATSVVAQKDQYLCRITAKISNGTNKGEVIFTQLSGSKYYTVNVRVQNLTPGNHGVHVHEKPDLGNECINTGGHYNPSNVGHGCPETSKTQHAGDLGNFNMTTECNKYPVKTISAALLPAGIKSFLNRSVVIHQDEDDCGLGNWPDSKTNGHSGKRIACGVITNYQCNKLDSGNGNGNNGNPLPINTGGFPIDLYH